jgi:hypothetical protein
MSFLAAVILAQLAASMETVTAVLAFPEPGLDDSAAYEGYRTRFLRDAARNTVQIYINQRDGRVVHVWADAANASAGMTLRGRAGSPARLDWGPGATRIGVAGAMRIVEYELIADAEALEIGAFVLGSMRLERDFQYQRGHLAAFAEAVAGQPELLDLIARLERLPPGERQRHLDLLLAGSTVELRSRLQPMLRQSGTIRRAIRIEQPSFDGRNQLSIELTFENAEAALDSLRRTISVRPRDGEPIRIGVRIATDGPTLAPLSPDEIFNAEFREFLSRLESERNSAEAAARLRRIDRQIRSLELVSSEQKLMAGLPNYATYFGRDMLMSALMLEPIWASAMTEHVLASVLRKLNASGEVSHEEALGGQAIRENAVVYNALIDTHLSAADGQRADALLDSARLVLGRLQAVRENYHMVDDDFQLPVLAARYLTDAAVTADRKRLFLLAEEEAAAGPRIERLLRNLAFVAHAASPYALEPIPGNLISFAQGRDGRWSPGSWRDSGAGYGNGRFAMDVNAIWVPQALESMDRILTALNTLGFPADEMGAYARGNEMDALLRHARDRAGLRAAVATWRGARRHFEVVLTADEARVRARGSLAQLSPVEGNFWQSRLDTLQPGADVRFLAVALDSIGRPIEVVNTDAATRLFLEDPDALAPSASEMMGDLDALMMPYPLGLFVPELGPLVANDVYAAQPVREAFGTDLYHSPRVIWGREVNLLLLGLARNIAAAYDGAGRLRDPSLAPYVDRLREALARTIAAVEASGLKHNELWSYRVEENRLLPIRYGASTDIQLWNLTDLAVQFALDRLPVSAGDSPAGEYDDLATLFAEWREFESPEIVDGVPDYSPAAMATQYAELPRWKARLEALDPTDWSVPDQIDWHLVRAEMNGLDFDHRVRQPWTRDPAFYVTIFPSESDVPAHEGPVIHGWIDLWKYEYPLSAAAAAELARRIGAIPALLEQARGNLTGNARDLWLAGLRSFRGQSADLAAFGERIAGTDASLDAAIAAAREASDAFHAWLEEQAPSKNSFVRCRQGQLHVVHAQRPPRPVLMGGDGHVDASRTRTCARIPSSRGESQPALAAARAHCQRRGVRPSHERSGHRLHAISRGRRDPRAPRVDGSGAARRERPFHTGRAGRDS